MKKAFMKKAKPKLDKRALVAVLLCTTFTFGTPFSIMAAETQEDKDTKVVAEKTPEDKEEAKKTEDDNDFLLGGVVVTATRTEVEQFKANANVSVITAQDIEKNHWADLGEALRSVPGVYIANYGSAGYQTSNSFYINGSNNVVVLVDGIKMGAMDKNNGKISPSMFANLDNIERIEVLKGSASTLYGSEAKGGVINIITKKIDNVKTTLKIGGGSFGAENYSLNHYGRQDGWSWRFQYQKDLAGDYKDGEGKRWYSRLNAVTQSFLIKRDFNSKSDFTVTYDSYKTDRNDYENFPPSPYGGINSNPINNYDVKAIYNFRFNDKTTNQLSYLFSSYDWGKGAYGETMIETQRVSDQFTRQINDEHTLTAGFEYTEEKIEKISNVPNKNLSNISFYLQDEWKFAPQWKLTGGVRYDDHSGFGNQTSPSVNLGYEFNPDTNMYVSWNKYFIAPGAYDLYGAYENYYNPGQIINYGNPDLKPETGQTYEIGINHKFDDTLVASAHLFKRSSQNRIGAVGSYGTIDNKAANVGDQDANGWDIQLKKKFSESFSTYVGYTHTNIDPVTGAEKNQNGYIPKGAWNIGVDYTKNKLDVSLLGRGVIDRPGPSDAVAGGFFPANSYWVWDIGINYRTSPHAKVFVKVNNIFNKYYAEQSNARVSFWGNPGEWWAMPGRNIYAGMQYSF